MKKYTGLISRLNAWLLHKSSGRYNQLVDERKRSLLSGVTGRVLEIGPGTGANLEYYPETITLTGLEPSPHMQDFLKEKARETGKQMEIITGTAENIPAADESFDVVVSTLVLCSVDSPYNSLSEIKRVLKPDGQFLFIEHVAAPDKSFLRSIQRWIKPFWKRVADGCHPDRKTWLKIENAGFNHVKIEHFRLSLPVIGPQIIGVAVK